MPAIKPFRIPCTRGVPKPIRAPRLRAARTYPPRMQPRHAILLGLWDGGSVVLDHRRPEDAVEAVNTKSTLIQRLEDMRDFCEGVDGDRRPHPANVAKLCSDVLAELKP